MNINKQRMEYVYKNRHIKKNENELMDYFFQIARRHANHLKIDYNIREDYIQETVSTAIKSLEKYDPTKNSKAFSYFYKVIYMRFLWLLRRDNNKKKRRPATSSFDLLETTIQDSSSTVSSMFDEDKDRYIEIAGNIMPRSQMIEAVKNVRKNYKKFGENFTPKNSIEHLFYNQIIESERKKANA